MNHNSPTTEFTRHKVLHTVWEVTTTTRQALCADSHYLTHSTSVIQIVIPAAIGVVHSISRGGYQAKDSKNKSQGYHKSHQDGTDIEGEGIDSKLLGCAQVPSHAITSALKTRAKSQIKREIPFLTEELYRNTKKKHIQGDIEKKTKQ